jgi:hypothetical protein
LSFNRINFIENGTFINLNKLKSLDLNYNSLLQIENDLFVGLANLNDLYLISENELQLFKNSFRYLTIISSIVLTESSISKHKCLFMHDLQRDVKRNISNKYVFYKSINLLTLNFTFGHFDDVSAKCDLVFNLFQFKIHFNLKFDESFHKFVDSCDMVLIKNENKFFKTKRKCNESFELSSGDEEEYDHIYTQHPFLNVLFNTYYLISMILLLTLLCPFFYLILRYEIFSKLKNHSRNEKDTIPPIFEKEQPKMLENKDKELNVERKSEIELFKKKFTISTRSGHNENIKLARENETF